MGYAFEWPGPMTDSKLHLRCICRIPYVPQDPFRAFFFEDGRGLIDWRGVKYGF